MPTHLVIHGHFYQPPRENPWTELVEPEPSAAPFHDWNERIYQECYRANGNARVVRPGGQVEAIENNYLYLSYNFGPTLMSWMERSHPHGYQRVLEADKESAVLRGGHGNAIAQGYNHCILPLCNERDTRTQIRWGLREFRHRFGREAESIWLPETACNDRVLGACIDEGLRFIILAPSQCLRIRPLKSAEWTLVENADVDPGRAYRYFHRDKSGRHLALFFYDGPLARALAFGEGLKSSHDLLDVLSRAPQGEGRLVSLATDGESYGHHTKWGDRTLAYALSREAKGRGFRVTNYGEFLDLHPPEHEAEIKAGPDGEGTAWSCAHGVGRWIRDCGCQTGGESHWNQKWRAPLRKALDFLRDFAAPAYEKAVSGMLKDPWAARDAFIAVLLEPGEASRERFFAAHASRPLSTEEKIRCMQALDMQRQAMLMYTSCGWFFTDLSGIETVQILKYACRLMDDLAELGFVPPRREFLEILGEARSNLSEFGSGADIFRRWVEPLKVGPDRLAAHLAISGLMESEPGGSFGVFDWELSQASRESLGNTRLITARVGLTHRINGRRQDLIVAAARLGGIDFHCCVSRFESEADLDESAKRVGEAFRRGLVPPLLRVIREEFGVREFGLHDLLSGHRERIAKAAFTEIVADLSQEFRHVYEENRRYLEMFSAAGFRLPEELRIAAEYTLSRQFEQEILAQKRSHDPASYEGALRISAEAQRQGLRLDRFTASRIFGELVTESVRRAMEKPDSTLLKKALALLRLTRQMGLSLNLDRAQEFAVRAKDMLHAPDSLEELAQLLDLEPSLLMKNGKP